MDLQRQAAELRERQLPPRPPPGQRAVPLQRRDLPAGQLPQARQGLGLKVLLKVFTIAALAGLLACANAYGLKSIIGSTVVSTTATIFPRALPAKRNVPVTVSSITGIKKTDGAQPPQLSRLIFGFDKNGSVDTKGLPVCTAAKLP